MTIELTPMIAARIVELAREHEETPDALVCRVLASRFEELDEVLDEIDVGGGRKRKAITTHPKTFRLRNFRRNWMR